MGIVGGAGIESPRASELRSVPVDSQEGKPHDAADRYLLTAEFQVLRGVTGWRRSS
jgi:hypothetical protein